MLAGCAGSGCGGEPGGGVRAGVRPDAGLAVLDEVDPDALGGSSLLLSVRGDLLERAGLHARASEAFTRAAERTRSEGERAILRRCAEQNQTAGSSEWCGKT